MRVCNAPSGLIAPMAAGTLTRLLQPWSALAQTHRSMRRVESSDPRARADLEASWHLAAVPDEAARRAAARIGATGDNLSGGVTPPAGAAGSSPSMPTVRAARVTRA